MVESLYHTPVWFVKRFLWLIVAVNAERHG
jgi:hypothetical protein